jgi:hypothetical protein
VTEPAAAPAAAQLGCCTLHGSAASLLPRACMGAAQATVAAPRAGRLSPPSLPAPPWLGLQSQQ